LRRRYSMKKGYFCPQCGNKESGRLEVISNDHPSFPLLLAPQKILRHPDVRISCSDCGWLADSAIFRAKKRWEFCDVR
jgi:uncharacterized Zn finger protein